MKQSPNHHPVERMYRRPGGQGRAPLKQTDHVHPTGTDQGHLSHGCPRAGLSGADLALNVTHAFGHVIPRHRGYTSPEAFIWSLLFLSWDMTTSG